MSETKTPGTAAAGAVITPECRTNRGDGGALEEAISRVRRKYHEICKGWKDAPVQPTMRLVLTVERPVETANPDLGEGGATTERMEDELRPDELVVDFQPEPCKVCRRVLHLGETVRFCIDGTVTCLDCANAEPNP